MTPLHVIRTAYRDPAMPMFRRRRPVARFDQLPPEDAVRLAYDILLGRPPDPSGWADFVTRLTEGRITNRQLVEEVRGSEEFRFQRPFTDLARSLHMTPCDFV